MPMSIHQPERHRLDRVGWLRAAVLGANDGLISTSSLLTGIIASAATRSTVILTGLAGLCAGSLSMAAGEYVSVSAQSDAEAADTERERRELATDPDAGADSANTGSRAGMGGGSESVSRSPRTSKISRQSGLGQRIDLPSKSGLS